MNFIVKLISKQKINEIRFCLINLQEDNQKILQCMNLIEQDKQKLRQYWTNIFNKIHFIEIKALSTEIIKYFVFLLNPIDQLRKIIILIGYSINNWYRIQIYQQKEYLNLNLKESLKQNWGICNRYMNLIKNILVLNWMVLNLCINILDQQLKQEREIITIFIMIIKLNCKNMRR
ncbi:unnamed protein product [Paramecium pentaurelia]|uniref:Uncharacterized protein n=1 Tax=Paramecium pentaurelia TaxID=43138 RepID=A0A8S1YEW7_9CILI|nr:unnamed protein product [Paramecium pentaurelia]